jgi:hypothetical protein
MYKKMAIALVTLGFGISHADEVYKLEAGENVSSLLVNRLKHSIIYRNKYLDEILKYNNLNRRSARRLRVGKEIKIPSAVIDAIAEEKTLPVTETPQPIAEIAPTQETSPAPIEYFRWLRLGVAFENLRGKSVGNSTPNDYSLTLVRPILGLGFDGIKNGHELYSSIDASFVKLADDSLRTGRDSFILAEGSLLYRKRFKEDWAFGAIGEFGQEIYVEVKTNKKYELQTPWIFGMGPHLNYKALGLSYLFVPTQKITSNQSTKDNYKVLLNYKIKHHDNYWLVEGSYSDISPQDSDSLNFAAKIQYNWKF